MKRDGHVSISPHHICILPDHIITGDGKFWKMDAVIPVGKFCFRPKLTALLALPRLPDRV
jgi:hypothetical protein